MAACVAYVAGRVVTSLVGMDPMLAEVSGCWICDNVELATICALYWKL